MILFICFRQRNVQLCKNECHWGKSVVCIGTKEAIIYSFFHENVVKIFLFQLSSPKWYLFISHGSLHFISVIVCTPTVQRKIYSVAFTNGIISPFNWNIFLHFWPFYCFVFKVARLFLGLDCWNHFGLP